MSCTNYNRYINGQSVHSQTEPDRRKVECPKCGRKIKCVWHKMMGTMWGGIKKNEWLMFLPRH